jgi:hypothetical protein
MKERPIIFSDSPYRRQQEAVAKAGQLYYVAYVALNRVDVATRAHTQGDFASRTLFPIISRPG